MILELQFTVFGFEMDFERRGGMASELPGIIRPRLRGQEDMDLPVKMEWDCHQSGIGRGAYAHRGGDHCDTPTKKAAGDRRQVLPNTLA